MHACLLGYNLKSAPQFETSLCPNVLTVIIYTNDVNETKENNKLQAHAESFDLIWVYTSSENYYHLQYEITSFFPTAYSSIRTLSPHRSVINCLAWNDALSFNMQWLKIPKK